MVAAVVAVGLSVVAWTASTFSAQQQQASGFFSNESQKIQESFVIEDVWFYSSPAKGVNVTIRNVGTVGMAVTAIDFNGTHKLGAAQNILIGEAKTITITWAWQDGYYYIVVASARGQQIREFYSTWG
jgi:archaellum component FlaF (FlaF/FlaG flagellin family)